MYDRRFLSGEALNWDVSTRNATCQTLFFFFPFVNSTLGGYTYDVQTATGLDAILNKKGLVMSRVRAYVEKKGGAGFTTTKCLNASSQLFIYSPCVYLHYAACGLSRSFY